LAKKPARPTTKVRIECKIAATEARCGPKQTINDEGTTPVLQIGLIQSEAKIARKLVYPVEEQEKMALFDMPKREDYPKRWKDMSLELKLMFVYHACMMVLFIAGGAFSLRQELTLTGVLLAVLVAISMRHRRSANWRWQSAKSKNLLGAAASAGT